MARTLHAMPILRDYLCFGLEAGQGALAQHAQSRMDDEEARYICRVLSPDWIMSHCGGTLTSKTLFVMRKDIEEAKAEDRLGMDMDKQTWEKFLRWIKEEQGETD